MKSSALFSAILCMVATLICGCATIKPPRHASPIERTLEVTGYCKCGQCTGWRRNRLGRAVYSNGPNKGKPKAVGVTASGTRARAGTIAADTSRYPFNTIMYVPGYGYGRVEDRGSAIVGDHIDLFFRTHTQAVKWGRQKKKVKIWLP